MSKWLVALLFAAISMYPMIVRAQALQILWIDPMQGPICAGPLGPGPCQMIAQYINSRGQQSVGIPINNSLPTNLPLNSNNFTNSIDSINPINASITSGSVGGAIDCARMTNQSQNPDVQSFLVCTRGTLVLNKDSATLVGCAEQTNGNANNFAECAGRGIIGSRLNQDQIKVVNCAAQNPSDSQDFAECIANGLAASHLNSQQIRIMGCAADNDIDSGAFAGCTAKALFGNRVPPEATAAIDCAVQSQGDFQQFGGCAASKFLQLNLNPEQQIAVQCVVSSGGQPYVAAGCTASRLTTRELSKCATNGIGGNDGCFGNNNDLVGRNGFVVRNLAGLAGGPNSVIRDPGQLLGGPNSVLNNPRQLLGGPNSLPNQILRNVPSPPPIQVGKIGNNRICIPWC